jgi:benzoate/toluate 1,2-dioxygenase subunit beta
MLADRAEIEQFLYKEARLLDTQKFEEWLDLFTEDACYWVPAGRDDIDRPPTCPSSTTTKQRWRGA